MMRLFFVVKSDQIRWRSESETQIKDGTRFVLENREQKRKEITEDGQREIRTN